MNSPVQTSGGEEEEDGSAEEEEEEEEEGENAASQVDEKSTEENKAAPAVHNSAENREEQEMGHERPSSFMQRLGMIDECYLRHMKRARNIEHETSGLLRLPPAAPPPFQEDGDALEAAITAVARVTRQQAPPFRPGSDHNEVYRWVWQTVLAFGREMQEEGRNIQRAEVGLPLSRPHALQAMQLMETLQELLTNHSASLRVHT